MAELVDFAEIQSQPQQSIHDVDDDYTMEFLDSLDRYMMLLDSLSSTFGQGWFQLASARHSMGASRINSALLNLKPHNAATRLQVSCDQDQPQFTLCKWVPCEDRECVKTENEDDMLNKLESLTTEDRCALSPEPQEKSSSTNLPAVDDEKRVQRERLKSLAVFGALVPPRLRDSQLSFEKALEILVEIANARSSMLYAFSKLKTDTKGSKASYKNG